MMELRPVEEQVVVLMGASSGIGREAAFQFAELGAQVVVSARDEEGLRSLVEEIGSMGGEAAYITADVSDPNQVRRVAEFAAETFGGIDTWVHLAAVSLWATFEQTTPEEFRRIVEVNLLGQVHGAQAALPYLRQEGRGALIHVTSVEAVRTLPYQAAYGASKHGVAGFIEALRLELQEEGLPVSVTNIMPGTINTNLFNKARSKLGVMPKGLPPVYAPELVAEAIVHAAEHPTKDLYIGDAGWFMGTLQRLAPRLLDAYLLSSAFEGQRTNRRKGFGEPDNLYEPLEGYDYVKGDFGRQTLPISIYDTLQTRPKLRRVALGLLAGAAALVAVRSVATGGNGQAQNKRRGYSRSHIADRQSYRQMDIYGEYDDYQGYREYRELQPYSEYEGYMY
jgi:NAD(P)-dependent dehydrogenase (short-subunit alcohol dehydrogenase family)